MVQELEQTLETDRNLLKSMKVDHAQATRDRDKILAKLRKTEMVLSSLLPINTISNRCLGSG